MTIKDMKVGESGFITFINIKGVFHLKLLDMGFTPNTLIKVQKIAPFNGPIQLQIRSSEVIIRKETAEKIYVRKVVN